MASKFPTTFTGKGYQAGYAGIAAELFAIADKVNGKLLAPDADGGIYYPRLTWGQIVALTLAWKRAAGRSTVRWGTWYDLTKHALGWGKEGDRFIMEKSWAETSADPSSLALFWTEIDRLAISLDNAGTKIAPIYVDWSWPAYEAAARDAWNQMKIEREAPKSSPDPKLEDDADRGASESSGWGNGILLIALLIAAGMASKKRR